MELDTISMPREAAREQFLAYKRALDRRGGGTEQDRITMEGYRQIAAGHVLLEINHVMQAAGQDAWSRPMLAIARADAKRVFFDYEWVGRSRCPTFTMEWSHRKRINTKVVLRRRLFGLSQLDEASYRVETALVPTIPPALRPRKTELPHHFILWEADWEAVPVDPILLRPVAGTLYAVVAQWDLTPLEQAVLAGSL